MKNPKFSSLPPADVSGGHPAQTRFSIETSWSYSSLGEDLGLAGIVAEDIDKNGRVELVLSSSRDDFDFTTRGYFRSSNTILQTRVTTASIPVACFPVRSRPSKHSISTMTEIAN